MEERTDYVTETQEALDMLEHKEPSVVIERPRVIAEKQPNGEFVERTIPVYVKYSTEFKNELKNITGSELKVWTYIILSINESGIAFPGIRTIADAIGLSHQTVITAIEGLEEKKLLSVVRGERKYNLYQPSDEYVAIFDKSPMSQKIRPVKKLEQGKSQISKADESSPLDLNKTLNKTVLNNDDENIAFLKELYEQNIGAATPLLMKMFSNALKSYPRDWFQPAFEVTVKSASHRSWSFVEAVLDGWHKNGFGWKPSQKGNSKPNGKTQSSTPTDYTPADYAIAAEIRAARGLS